MRITSIETKVEHIALKTPFVTALRRVDTIEFVRVFIACDNANAIGEAPATVAITGEDIDSILNSIEDLKESLYDLKIDEALKVVHSSSIGSSAKAALDMALVSLMAEEKNMNLASYFGTKDFQPIQTDITISLNEPMKMLQDAKEAISNGMSILKVKLGADISHSISVSQLLLKELPEAILLIDANQAWSREDALFYVDAMKDSTIELIEQPVVAEDIEGLKLITNATNIPILADEATFTLEDVKKVVESKSADMINIKLMKCGGLSKAREILEYAREKKVKCMLGSMLEGPYSINAALYLAFAYKDVLAYIDLDSPLLYKERVSELDFNFHGNRISYSDSLEGVGALL